MSHDNADHSGPIVASAVLLTITGAVIGACVNLYTWTDPYERTSSLYSLQAMLAGGAVGAAIGFVVSFGGAWHATSIVGSSAVENSHLWGLFSGLLLGFSFGPVVGLLTGWGLDIPVTGGALGCILGPLFGILSWQLGYWAQKLGWL